MRRGWNRNSLKPGTIITVEGFRSKDEPSTANARSVKLSDGRQVFAGFVLRHPGSLRHPVSCFPFAVPRSSCSRVSRACSAAALKPNRPKSPPSIPSSLTMGVREHRDIVVATRSGKTPARVEWTISNPAVATIAPRGASADIAAASPGPRARYRARQRTNVDGAMTVGDEPELRLGTTRWSRRPRRRDGVASAARRHRAWTTTAPDLFAVDADPMKRFAVVRALRANGTLVWQATVRGTPWAGDRFGGLLVRLGALDQPSRTLARVDRPRSRVACVAIQRARRHRRLRGVRRRNDLSDDPDASALGRARREQRGGRDRRQDRPRDRSLHAAAVDVADDGVVRAEVHVVRRPSELGSLGEGTNGGVYAEMLIMHDTWTRVCQKGRPMFGRGRFKISRELQLVRMTRWDLTPFARCGESDVEGAGLRSIGCGTRRRRARPGGRAQVGRI